MMLYKADVCQGGKSLTKKISRLFGITVEIIIFFQYKADDNRIMNRLTDQINYRVNAHLRWPEKCRHLSGKVSSRVNEIFP